MTRDKAEEALRRRHIAERLLAELDALGVLAELRADAIQSMLVAEDDRLAERRAHVLAIEALRSKLEALIANGKLVQKTLEGKS